MARTSCATVMIMMIMMMAVRFKKVPCTSRLLFSSIGTDMFNAFLSRGLHRILGAFLVAGLLCSRTLLESRSDQVRRKLQHAKKKTFLKSPFNSGTNSSPSSNSCSELMSSQNGFAHGDGIKCHLPFARHARYVSSRVCPKIATNKLRVSMSGSRSAWRQPTASTARRDRARFSQQIGRKSHQQSSLLGVPTTLFEASQLSSSPFETKCGSKQHHEQAAQLAALPGERPGLCGPSLVLPSLLQTSTSRFMQPKTCTTTLGLKTC